MIFRHAFLARVRPATRSLTPPPPARWVRCDTSRPWASASLLHLATAALLPHRCRQCLGRARKKVFHLALAEPHLLEVLRERGLDHTHDEVLHLALARIPTELATRCDLDALRSLRFRLHARLMRA